MTTRKFRENVDQLFRQRWSPLHEKFSVDREDLKFPGVYLIAYSRKRLTNSVVDLGDVFYVGMSNSAGGVRQRLKQFKDGIEVNNRHSGAMRFFREHCNGKPFSSLGGHKKFYFAALTFRCVSDKSKVKASDLRTMGRVACLEYFVLAHLLEINSAVPMLNKLSSYQPKWRS